MPGLGWEWIGSLAVPRYRLDLSSPHHGWKTQTSAPESAWSDSRHLHSAGRVPSSIVQEASALARNEGGTGMTLMANPYICAFCIHTSLPSVFRQVRHSKAIIIFEAKRGSHSIERQITNSTVQADTSDHTPQHKEQAGNPAVWGSHLLSQVG